MSMCSVKLYVESVIKRLKRIIQLVYVNMVTIGLPLIVLGRTKIFRFSLILSKFNAMLS